MCALGAVEHTYYPPPNYCMDLLFTTSAYYHGSRPLHLTQGNIDVNLSIQLYILNIFLKKYERFQKFFFLMCKI